MLLGSASSSSISSMVTQDLLDGGCTLEDDDFCFACFGAFLRVLWGALPHWGTVLVVSESAILLFICEHGFD